ncbi:MAG: serine hydrolase [Tunicatimonas sp.]
MKDLYLALFALFFACSGPETADTESLDALVDDQNFIYQLLAKQSDTLVNEVINHPSRYELQVLYTQIDRDSANRPSFTSHYYGIDTNTYFYPASTVKLPVALLALEKLNELDVEGLDKYTPLRMDSAFDGQTRVEYDSTAENLKPSVAQYVRKIFVVSDNDAYNRLYEFLGQDYINNQLKAKGYDNFKIVHRLSVFNTVVQNQHTNPVQFYDDAKVLYQQDLIQSARSYDLNVTGTTKGVGYYRNDSLINEPKDFSGNNTLSVRILQDILKSVLFPEAVPEAQRFNLTDDDYRFVYRYMSQLPRETAYPNYASDTTEDYYDSYSKFFLFGDSKDEINDNVRIFNKIGQAYGYLTDNAYVVDFDNNVEFMLTAVIHVNKNQIYNDNEYEYDEVGLPFLAKLGQAVLDYERQRERKYQPDLRRFRVDYDR